MLLQEFQTCFKIFLAHFNPTIVDAHQRRTFARQRFKGLHGEGLITQRNLPGIIHNTVQAKSAFSPCNKRVCQHFWTWSIALNKQLRANARA